MCGIAGIIRLKKDYNLSEAIQRMVDTIHHRGPDGEGTMVEGDVALGHRRLAIIDLSDQSAQPMTNKSKTLTIVYNGEIYNYVELREELRSIGREFATTSDTEVLLQAYDEWGTDCVGKLNGMWSFAILDRRKRRLFCSRDRFGEKPFYYTHTKNGFLISSEIRQILPEIDRVAGNVDLLKRFLLGVVGDDLQEAFFEGIHKLPGGHNLEYDLERNSVSVWRYYQIAFNTDLYQADFQENQAQFFELLQDAIRIRMRSDVPVGTCLSGGLDSSSIATLAAQLYNAQTDQKFKAITACSTEPQNDESSYASEVVQNSGLDWIRTKPDYDGFTKSIDDVVRTQEEPFGSASIVMQYFVMQAAAKNGVRVLLDGQGGDEVLMGYERYFIPYFRELISKGNLTRAFLEIMDMTRNNSVMSISSFLKYAVYFSSASIREQRIKHRTSFLREMPASIAEIKNYAKAAKSVSTLQRYEVETSNLPPLLRFEDKNAMRFSVETRLPLLDYRIVELGCSIPVHHKIKNGWTKYILRESIRHHLPDDIVWRKNKIGFAAPQRTWMKNYRDKMLEIITESELLRELVHMDSLVHDGFNIDSASFWRLYAVASWEANFSVAGLSQYSPN